MFGERSGHLIRYGLTLVCLFATVIVFLSVDRIIRSRGELAFVTVTNDNLSALASRLKSYSQALDGLAGLLDASDEVSPLDWRHYVLSLKIGDNLPGLTGLAYIRMVDDEAMDRFQADLHSKGISDLEIHPETGRKQKLVITYIEPIEGGAKARGLDIGFEESRRVTALESRDSGLARTTPPIQLVQSDIAEPGILLLRPYYQRGMPVSNPVERRQAFRGWISASIVASRLLLDLTLGQDEMFAIKVSDPLARPDRRIIFESNNGGTDAASGTFARGVNLPVFGRTWILEWRSTPAFDLSQNRYAKWLFLIAGLTITTLFFLYMRAAYGRHQLVARQVERKTRDMSALLEQNRSILDNALVGILVLDGKDRIIQANPAAEQLFSRSEEALLQMRLQDLTEENTTQPHVSPGVVKARTIGGRRLYLDIQRNHWIHGSESRETVLIRDVTEEIQANRALVESGRRWNLALKGAEIGVYDIDLVKKTSVVSDTWLRLMELPLDDPNLDYQQNFISRVHPDDLKLLQQSDKACIAGLTARSMCEYRIKFKDGWRWMHSDGAVAERDANGKALRFIGAQTDVTKLRLAREALARSEDRFRLVLSNAPVGMAVMDLDGRLDEANTAICNMTGYSLAELDGFRFVELFPEDEIEALSSRIAGLLGESGDSYSGEHRIIRKDGTHRWGEVKVSCVVDFNQGGEIYIVQINDVTHKREVDRVKNEFVATVSHELRTPLTSIKGALGLLIGTNQDQFEGPARRLLGIAAANTERLILLVNDILDMEKISAGKEKFDYADVSSNQLIRETALQIRPIADRQKVRLVHQAVKTDALVRVDPDRATQVLSNLLSNACKFSYPGGVVELAFSVEGAFARFRVVDHGQGIPENFRAKIFDRFSQADSSDTRREGGTGLGLSISKQIVERMGGEIGFDSVPEERTEFWFTCPLAKPQISSKLKPVIVPPRPGPMQSQAKRILHLEDDAEFAAIVRASLAEVATVVTVSDVGSAQAALGDGSYDVIILDWKFSDDQAKALLDDIDLRQPQARVVALSADESGQNNSRFPTTLTNLRNSPPEVVSWLRDEMEVKTK